MCRTLCPWQVSGQCTSMHVNVCWILYKSTDGASLYKLTLAVPRHSDGDCKGTVTDSYRSNLDWV